MKSQQNSIGDMMLCFGFLGLLLVVKDRPSEQYPVDSAALDDFLPNMDGIVLSVWDGLSATEGEPIRLPSPGGYIEVESIRWRTVDGEPLVTLDCFGEDGQLKRGMTVAEVMAATAIPMQEDSGLDRGTFLLWRFIVG